MCVGVSVWFVWSGIRVAGWSTASACNTDTTPSQPHRNSNTHPTKNNTTNVVVQQNSRKLLMMDILMSETCWPHKKWNKIPSDIKLVFYYSTNTMTHRPISKRFLDFFFNICNLASLFRVLQTSAAYNQIWIMFSNRCFAYVCVMYCVTVGANSERNT